MAVLVTDAQVNVYARDPELLASFYTAIGMTETFRFPVDGTPEQIEVAAGRLTLGFTSVDALERLAGLTAQPGAPSAEVVLWCRDVDTAFAAARALGAHALASPRVFNGRIRAAWVEDPEGNRVKLVSIVAPSDGRSQSSGASRSPPTSPKRSS